MAGTRAGRSINDFGTHIVETETKTRVDNFKHPVPIGDSYYELPQKAIHDFENTPPTYQIR